MDTTNTRILLIFFEIGMYLLTQTGFLSECMNYIDERWRSKGQVGKLEQYGYGYLLSQMASTPAVISRLDHLGMYLYFLFSFLFICLFYSLILFH